MSAEPKNVSSTGSEPTSALTTAPVWLFVLMLLLLFWSAVSFDQHGGWFDAQVYTPFTHPPEDWQPRMGPANPAILGKAVYNRPTCVACHQASGLGIPGQFPPLVKSEWINEQKPGRIIRIVLNGLQGPITVEGQGFNNAMVPWKGVLSDEEIAAVLTYVRQNKEWGNHAPTVTPEQVKAVRDKIKDRSQPFSAEELLKISPAD